MKPVFLLLRFLLLLAAAAAAATATAADCILLLAHISSSIETTAPFANIRMCTTLTVSK